MKKVSITTRIIRLSVMLLILTAAGKSVYAQKAETAQTFALNYSASAAKAKTPASENTGASLDTISCMFHQIINNRPTLSWRTGYIVLENQKIIMDNVSYPTSNASQLTGLIQNTFLSSNKKKVVNKQVIQVVLLQPSKL